MGPFSKLSFHLKSGAIRQNIEHWYFRKFFRETYACFSTEEIFWRICLTLRTDCFTVFTLVTISPERAGKRGKSEKYCSRQKKTGCLETAHSVIASLLFYSDQKPVPATPDNDRYKFYADLRLAHDSFRKKNDKIYQCNAWTCSILSAGGRLPIVILEKKGKRKSKNFDFLFFIVHRTANSCRRKMETVVQKLWFSCFVCFSALVQKYSKSIFDNSEISFWSNGKYSSKKYSENLNVNFMLIRNSCSM